MFVYFVLQQDIYFIYFSLWKSKSKLFLAFIHFVLSLHPFLYTDLRWVLKKDGILPYPSTVFFNINGMSVFICSVLSYSRNVSLSVSNKVELQARQNSPSSHASHTDPHQPFHQIPIATPTWKNIYLRFETIEKNKQMYQKVVSQVSECVFSQSIHYVKSLHINSICS